MIFIRSPSVALPTSVGLEGFDTSPEVDAKIASGSYTLTNKIIDNDAAGNNINNLRDADIASDASISWSKVNNSQIIVNDNVSTTANIDASKLNLTDYYTSLQTDNVITSGNYTFTNKTFDVNGDGNSLSNVSNSNIAASANIDASKLNLTGYQKWLDHGAVQLPTFTTDTSGNFTITSNAVANFWVDDSLVQKTFTATPTLSMVDNSVNYIYLNYDTGYQVTQSPSTLNSDFTLVPMFRVVRRGTVICELSYDQPGELGSTKLLYKDIVLNGIQRFSGLTLSSSGTRISKIDSGVVYFGVQMVSVSANEAGVTGSLYHVYPVSGAYTTALATSYDNTYYSDGTDRLSLDNKKYVAKYFRMNISENCNIALYYSGNQYNSASEAFNEAVPTISPLFTSDSIYVGKIVVQEGTTVTTVHPRVWGDVMVQSGAISHNDLSGRDAVDTHPIGSITSLSATLSGLASSNSHATFTTLTVGDTSGNTFNIESDGTPTLSGNAKCWDDLRVEPSVRGTGSNNPPFEKWIDNGAGSRGVYLYSFDDTATNSQKEIFFTAQFPHDWDGGTVSPHVHWIANVNSDEVTNKVKWVLEYSWTNINEVFANTSIVSGNVNYGDGSLTAKKHYLTETDDITPSDTQNHKSSIMVCRLYRNSGDTVEDTYPDKVGLLYVDIHYQRNSFGSREEYV